MATVVWIIRAPIFWAWMRDPEGQNDLRRLVLLAQHNQLHLKTAVHGASEANVQGREPLLRESGAALLLWNLTHGSQMQRAAGDFHGRLDHGFFRCTTAAFFTCCS